MPRVIVVVIVLAAILHAQMLMPIVGGASRAVNPVPINPPITQTSGPSQSPIGQATASFKRAQQFTLAAASRISAISIRIYRTNTNWLTPADVDTLSLQILTESASAGEQPSATVAATTTTTPILCSTLAFGTSGTDYTFNFANVSLAAGKYWIVPLISPRSAINTTDYLNWKMNGAGGYTGGVSTFANTSGVWSDGTGVTQDYVFTVTGTTP